ncbi:MAG TPA: M20/M25/M40 family metallo-hydrolase [Candidatus Dormibacteraeota bacterium]|nr:M20/M25/M40 family metallo-hydrolase [Candidatus Dormibacteraeota bacterium]
MSVPVSGAVALDPAALLEELLRHPSPTGSVEAAAEALAGLAHDAGFATGTDLAGSVVMTWGDAGPPIAGAVVLLGHLDTVPGGPPVRLAGARLHGRGTVDAKGPLAAALAGVSRLPREGPRVTLVAAVDEEGASGCAAALSRTAPAAHLIVLEPSGWDAITVGYRGCVRLRIALEQETAHHALPRPSAGDRLVAMLADLRRRLEELGVESGGRTGERAVDQLQMRVNRLSGDSDGGVERAAAQVEVRLPATVPVERVLGLLPRACAGAELVIESACPAVAVSRSNPVCRALVRAVAAQGGAARYTTKTGTSDLNVVLPAWGCPAAVYGPGDSTLDHTQHEFIEIEDLRRGARILELAVASLR